MTKQEFKTMCDRILKRYGFAKTHGQYYLDLGSDILGAMFFQASDYGSAYYLNCGFAIKAEMAVPYPKLADVNFSWRIAVPGKEKFTYNPRPNGYMSEMISYGEYLEEEIAPYIEQAFHTWVIPAIQNGKEFILNRDDLYGGMIRKARALHKIKE